MSYRTGKSDWAPGKKAAWQDKTKEQSEPCWDRLQTPPSQQGVAPVTSALI